MGRIEPEERWRLIQGLPGTVRFTFAGSEANVAASLGILGNEALFVTALPANDLAEACVNTMRAVGIDTRFILRREGRLGLFYVETGANQRPSRVIYDRENSSISRAGSQEYPWESIFQGAQWFHVTGITPALSEVSAEAVRCAAESAKAHGLTVSCDLNYRGKLWRWEPGTPPTALARRVMSGLLPHVDLVIANEQDASDVLGIEAENTDVEAGSLATDRYPSVAREICSEFPNVREVAITLRESISADHNRWGGMLYLSKPDRAYFAPLRDGCYAPYSITDIVDRIGAGDSFAAGLIHAATTDSLRDPQDRVSFAVASSCLCHSIHGDFNFSTEEEVLQLMRGKATGRVVR